MTAFPVRGGIGRTLSTPAGPGEAIADGETTSPHLAYVSADAPAVETGPGERDEWVP